MDPIVSIIIPCYNQAAFLEEAVNSVINQSFRQWECIIVNDFSTDNTVEIASGFATSNDRIQLLDASSNLGLPGARNLGIEKAKGTYILPLDADDKISRDYVSHAVSVFDRSPDTKLVYARAAFFGQQTGSWNLPPYHYAMLFARNPIYCSAIFRKKDWVACGGYDTNLKNGLEDWDFWLKLLSPEAEVMRLDEIGFYYRKHDQSMIGELVGDNDLFEETKQDMLLRHKEKWLSWSHNHMYPLLEQMQFYREREQQLTSNWLGRGLHKIARWLAKA